jgi:very-short-patch-repair endonuclease
MPAGRDTELMLREHGGRMPARRDIELMLRELGAAQHGVVARAQLLGRGLSVYAVDRLVRARRLTVLQRGVYQIGPLPLPRAAEKAAVLASGRDARLSHRTAARLEGMLEAAGPVSTVEVTMPRRKHRRLEGVRIHRVRDLRTDEVTLVDGMPITTPARTLLDIAETETARVVEQAYAKALRMRLVTPDMMLDIVERHPNHRGAPLWRRLLAEHGAPAFTRSEAEEKLLDIARSARLPRPELNVQVLGHELDFVWRDARVVAEVDGYAFHASARSFAADRRRDAELTAAGYRVLRFTWSDVTEGRMATVVRLAQALMR